MSDTTTVLSLDEFVSSHLTEESYTPFGIISNLNKILKDMGVEKVLPPQMGYNYNKNGLIVKGKKGVKSYTKTEVVTWMVKYLTKNVTK
jgi:hypothetical protein